MCNNPSYERPVISFQFAFVSVLLSMLSQARLLCRLQVFIYLGRSASQVPPDPQEVSWSAWLTMQIL